MEFVTEKWFMLRQEKSEKTEGIEQPNQENIFGEKKNYKYLWLLEADTIKQR